MRHLQHVNGILLRQRLPRSGQDRLLWTFLEGQDLVVGTAIIEWSRQSIFDR